MTKDIVEQRRVGKKVVTLLDLPFALTNYPALERVGERVKDITHKNGYMVIVVKQQVSEEDLCGNTSVESVPPPKMLWSAAGD